MRRLTAAVVTFLVATVSVAGMKIEAKRHPGTDYEKYATFGWAPKTNVHPDDPMAEGTALDRQLKETATKALAAKGVVYKETDPDLLLAFVGYVQDELAIEGMRVSAGRVAWVGDPNAHSVRTHQEGTLVIELVDPVIDKMVWTGWATDAAKSRVALRKKAGKAVERILRQYPSR